MGEMVQIVLGLVIACGCLIRLPCRLLKATWGRLSELIHGCNSCWGSGALLWCMGLLLWIWGWGKQIGSPGRLPFCFSGRLLLQLPLQALAFAWTVTQGQQIGTLGTG